MEQTAKHLSVNHSAEQSVPGAEILSAGLAYDRCDEVSLGQLSAFDRIVITTRNHTYEVVVTSPDTGDVLVRGGTVFPRFTAVRLNGSTAGGSLIKARSVNVGVRVEFAVEGYVPVVTSRVQTLEVEHH
jgi:hypothetical protein